MKKMDIMLDFEKASRTLMTRDLVYDRDYMLSHGILRIFNGVSSAEDDIDYLFDDPKLAGRDYLVERSYSCRGDGVPVIIISVVVFVDALSRNLFCLRSGEIYKGHELHSTLVN